MNSSSVIFRTFEGNKFFQQVLTSAQKWTSIEQLQSSPFEVLIFLLTLTYVVFLLSGIGSAKALSPGEFRAFKLEEIQKISPDTKRLRFALQSPETVLGLPTGQHITFRCKGANGEEIQRSYTPITSNDEKGYVDFIIKVYKKTKKFPNGGQMTLVLDDLNIGDTVDMRGPKGDVDYTGCGNFSINRMNTNGKKKKELYKDYNKFGFVAGGSGITPCLQVIREMLKNPNDHSDISLLYANKTEKDILLREELDAMAKNHKDRFRVHYTLDEPPTRWNGSKGFINEEMCDKSLPKPGPDVFTFMCGPDIMCQKAVKPALEKLGYSPTQCFKF